ncbi:hypothetical protein Hanom_Chr14g01289851 [Helianthus anomalus]
MQVITKLFKDTYNMIFFTLSTASSDLCLQKTHPKPYINYHQSQQCQIIESPANKTYSITITIRMLILNPTQK